MEIIFGNNVQRMKGLCEITISATLGSIPQISDKSSIGALLINSKLSGLSRCIRYPFHRLQLHPMNHCHHPLRRHLVTLQYPHSHHH